MILPAAIALAFIIAFPLVHQTVHEYSMGPPRRCFVGAATELARTCGCDRAAPSTSRCSAGRS
jgi:hypothetical protein